MSEKQRFLGIKKFRERLGWKQNQLSKMLGCKSTAAYHHWEVGKYCPSFEVIQKLFEMGATVEELFGIPYPNGGNPASKPNDIEKLSADIEALKMEMAALKGNRAECG